jgi:MFS transporter, PAT family, beta-lactamase induction signal transducer AmpG
MSEKGSPFTCLRLNHNILYFAQIMETAISPVPKPKHAHPIVFMFLMLPFGITSGYVTITLAFQFGKIGISMSDIASLSAATVAIGIVKFLVGPLVDGFLTLKKWCLLSGIFTAVGMLALGLYPIQPSSIVPLIWVIIIGNIGVSFLGIAISGLLAHDVPEEMKGRASGYYNTGNLGGMGLGGGAGLWLAEHIHNTLMPAAILALVCMLCSFGLFFIKEKPSSLHHIEVGKTLVNLFKDIWQTLETKLGLLALVLSFLPLGTGALQNLWAGVAGSWNASAATIEFVTGWLSGLITAGGCLIGGWICDRVNRKNAYLFFGLLAAICAVAMAYSPHTEFMFIFWTSLYAFILGLCYAAFSAFVFEVIGRGAAGTKYTVFACLSNIPILYMTKVEGWVFDSKVKTEALHGATGMLNIEAICAVIGIIIFLGLVRILRVPKEVGEA